MTQICDFYPIYKNKNKYFCFLYYYIQCVFIYICVMILSDSYRMKEFCAGRVFSRIVSLVPSWSRTLYEITGGEQPVGITKFCCHPEDMFRSRVRVGGTKKINVEKIRSIHPDLVIAAKEENVKEQVEEVAEFCPVWLTDVRNISEMNDCLEWMGTLTGKEERSREYREEISRVLHSLRGRFTGETVVYLIWKEPWLTIGSDTFIHSMLEHLGLRNLFGNRVRYPVTSLEEIQLLRPGYIFLSSEPFPFKEEDANELQKKFSCSKVRWVRGELFSWYGVALCDWKSINLDKLV